MPLLKEEEEPKKRIIFLYMIINIMFGFDLILTIFVIIANGGSLITFLKLPLKIYAVIPFPLKASYIPFLIPKFCRVDLFRRVFDSIEHFILLNITHYIQNYYLKSFMTYTNKISPKIWTLRSFYLLHIFLFGWYKIYFCIILYY